VLRNLGYAKEKTKATAGPVTYLRQMGQTQWIFQFLPPAEMTLLRSLRSCWP
jgi:hypothetical protein